MTFTSFSFDKRIDACVKACGYETPTPIQNQTIPLILQGHDVMGQAQTGTGKTAAFALPILQRLLDGGPAGNTPKALVLAPTRELALQINQNFNELSRNTGIRTAVVIGGVSMGSQIRALRSANIVIACPGRLIALLAQKAVSLRGVETLVLDEADRMLDIGFLPDIKRILAKLPAKRQNLLFSATMPKAMQVFARQLLVEPKSVKIDATSPVASIEHTFYRTHSSGKTRLLEDLIKQTKHNNMIIFTRTKRKAKKLSLQLDKRGYRATFLQGNMSQGQREKALKGFCSGKFPIMVATDIAARGIDCDRITHVINYDMPDTVEAYTHRTGRTGRAGRSGTAVSLVTQDDAAQLRAIQRAMKISVEQQTFTPKSRTVSPKTTEMPTRDKVAKRPGQNRKRSSRPGPQSA